LRGAQVAPAQSVAWIDTHREIRPFVFLIAVESEADLSFSLSALTLTFSLLAMVKDVLRDRSVRVLTNGPDNLPYWSPDGSRILFTRKQDENFDIYTIKPDGTDVRRMTTFPANDAHAVWSRDGKYIMWNSGEYGFPARE
jgi:Tol biopolymer transport system component